MASFICAQENEVGGISLPSALANEAPSCERAPVYEAPITEQTTIIQMFSPSPFSCAQEVVKC